MSDFFTALRDLKEAHADEWVRVEFWTKGTPEDFAVKGMTAYAWYNDEGERIFFAPMMGAAPREGQEEEGK